MNVSTTGQGRSYYVLSPRKGPCPIFSFSGSRSNFRSFFRGLFSVYSSGNRVGVNLRTAKPCSRGLFGTLISHDLPILHVGPLLIGGFGDSVDLHEAGASGMSTRTVTRVMGRGKSSLRACSASLCRVRRLGSLAHCHLGLINRRSGLHISISHLMAVLFPRLRSLMDDLRLTSVRTLLVR